MELVTFEIKEDLLTIKVNGRVDTTNAVAFETEIQNACDHNPTNDVVLDINGLEYISSAGLRVILRLKKNKPSLKVINANPEVYDIFDMTGFTEMIHIEKAFRKLVVDGCEVIGKGAKGTVYRYNPDTVVKVYNDLNALESIQNERELARKAFVLGVPTAIPYDVVKVGEKYGSVFELLDAKSYSTLIKENPEELPKYTKDYALLLKQIHSTMVDDSMPDGKNIARKWVKAVAGRLSKEDGEKFARLVESIPDTSNMLHCDYHTNNIMMQNGETLLIDMDTLCKGHPIIELANIYVTYVGFNTIDPKNVEEFLGFSYEIANEVWKYFIRYYLDTEDEERIKDVEKKIKVLGYGRMIRHIEHRWMDKDYAIKALETCANTLHNLLEEVNDLDI